MTTALTVKDLITNTAKMKSTEIAEVTGRNHKDVLRSIDKMVKVLAPDESRGRDVRHEIQGIKLVSYRDVRGKRQRMFSLDKENTFILITGFDTKFRQAVVRRWLELETIHANQQSLEWNVERRAGKALYWDKTRMIDVVVEYAIKIADRIVTKGLREGMDGEMLYKDIYQAVRTKLEMYAEIIGRTAVVDTTQQLDPSSK